jgi:hypothetical protein
MALVGVLSTQLLHNTFVEQGRSNKVDDDLPIVIIGKDTANLRNSSQVLA